MVSPLKGPMKKAISAAFAPVFFDATLLREETAAGRVPFDPGAPVVASFDCKAVVAAYSKSFREGGSVTDRDRKVLILGGSISTDPKPGDVVTVSGVSFGIISVAVDPAGALWECQGRM